MSHLHVLQLRLEVVPLCPPTLTRHCPRCDGPRPFCPAGRVRVNAHKRRLDVWLLYRCARCEQSWKLRLHRQIPPEALTPERLTALTRNDPAVCEALAFEAPSLCPGAGQWRPSDDISLEWMGSNPHRAPHRDQRFVTAFRHPHAIRLDQLLARALGLSRGAVARAAQRGQLKLGEGKVRRLLRRPAAPGLQVWAQAELWKGEGDGLSLSSMTAGQSKAITGSEPWSG